MTCDRRSFVGMMAAQRLIQSGRAPEKWFRGSALSGSLTPVFPRQDPQMVADFVLLAHFNAAKVKDMVTAHPALAKSAIDWGFGDWEDALGAASHMGRADIAQRLRGSSMHCRTGESS
ncbi:MAG: hypothetical protein U0132_13500 [Gemmatimonadaceae bacterium]